MDEAPAVRAAAVKGICSLLNVWWEIMPQATLIGFLRCIAGELDNAFWDDELLKHSAYLPQSPLHDVLVDTLLRPETIPLDPCS